MTEEINTTESRSVAWLIEWLHNDAPVPRYWHPVNGWVWRADEAIRFCRRDDAQACIDAEKWMAGTPTEHVFIGHEVNP